MATRSEDSYPEIIESGEKEREKGWGIFVSLISNAYSNASTFFFVISEKPSDLADYC